MSRTWVNRLLGLEDSFTFGDPASLPMEPFEYISRQAQGDWVLLDERDQTLYIGAGMTTERADYSIRFDLGMSWHEFHGPVPLAHELGPLLVALEPLGLLLQFGGAKGFSSGLLALGLLADGRDGGVVLRSHLLLV